MMPTLFLALLVGVIPLSLPPTNVPSANPPAASKPVRPSASKPEPLRLRVTLADGSQIIGVPAIEELPVKTGFAEMKVPLNRVRNATFSHDRSEIILVLSNGDRLSGTPQLGEFQLTCLFGKATVTLRHVTAFNVIPSRAAGQWPLDGLWGYWPLDGDAHAASGNGHDGIVRGAKPTEGVRGQAYFFDGQSVMEVGHPDFPNEEYTVAGWIRTEYPARREDWRTWISKAAGSCSSVSLGIGDGREQGGADGVQYFVYAPSQGMVVNLVMPRINLRDGHWHHCAVVYKKGLQKVLWTERW